MNIKIGDIVAELEKFAPLCFQESYDNAGLIVGDAEMSVNAALLCFDVTEKIVDEAIERRAGLVISHHPPIFGGIKKINGKNASERIVVKAIKNDIALYAAHTNLDSVWNGINTVLGEKLGLSDIKILVPREKNLYKIVTFVPHNHAENLRRRMFEAGAGHIGNYDSCSYNLEGKGTFRGGENTSPFVGTKGTLHSEPEIRIETVATKECLNQVIAAILQAHPYEEPAYDVYPLENKRANVGAGAVGTLPQAVDAADFLATVKKNLPVKLIRHNKLFKQVKTVAVCGGAGASLIADAIAAKTDLFLTGDCKYHQFLDCENKIILADIGHYESECFAVEIFYNIINKKFPTFALYLSHGISNPVQYFIK
ncbi:MAG: Nif3-like dinuclear metal center hexameric protein [Prevotellaceae bacterium]|jgi:dinuclear metal center YbgI/SA1388 family protein|nr:Nif3-like dinuclear metal center hexameric protein [Prevotellaceae bacterium]